ncbi:hypothetical protein [Flavobacterium sp.]|uniref:hypothetical protein n=1 Tax=Flavobacterium sp. TaxID=239 RepID=UPI0040481858
MRKYFFWTIIFYAFPFIYIIAQKNLIQKEFDKLKIDEDVYSFWWNKNNDGRFYSVNDTIPYLVNDKGYKGLLNYGLEFTSKNNKNFTFTESFFIHKLNINIDRYNFNEKDSILTIEGVVGGGWNNSDYKGIDNTVNIFIGEKKDTTNTLYSEYISNSVFKVEQNNVELFNHVALDTFPSCKIYNYTCFKTEMKEGKKKFKISAKINKNSILVFGLTSCFVEIFEVGKMFFDNNSNNIINQTDFKKEYPISILINNEYVYNKVQNSNNEKQKYYKIVEKAEDYILTRQYAKAKQEYELLLNENHYFFAKDLHNAVRCALISRDYESSIIWCEKLVLKGVELSYFNSTPFNKFKKSVFWKDFLDKYSYLNEKYKSGLNHELIKKIDELVSIDQRDHIKNTKGEIKRDKLKETTEYVSNEFLKLIEKEGFPTEEKIGIQMASNYVMSSSTKFFVLIIHSYQVKGESLQKIKDVRQSAISALEYDLRDNIDIFKKGGNTCLQIYKGNLYSSKTCSAVNELQIRKVKYTFNNEHNFLIDKGAFIVIPYEKENEKEMEIYIEERFDFITKLTDDWFFYEK